MLLGEQLTYAFDDPGAVELLSGLADGCAAAGTNLLLIATGNSRIGDTRLVDEAAVDAFVVWATPDRHPLIDAVRARGLPMVIHGSFPFAAERGERLTSGPDRTTATHYVTRTRLSGFADALAHASIDWRVVPVYEVAVNNRRHGYAAGAALLELEPQPDLILTMSDELALGVLQAARDKGVAVPAEVALTGWDNSVLAQDSHPPLSTVAQSLREQGSPVRAPCWNSQVIRRLPRTINGASSCGSTRPVPVADAIEHPADR